MNTRILISVLGIAALLVSGCTTLTVGSEPDKQPPKMVASEGARAWDNGKPVNVSWDRPAAFGPVPANLKTAGDNICQAAGFARAVGYHPSALGLDGRAVRGGGYLCAGYTR